MTPTPYSVPVLRMLLGSYNMPCLVAIPLQYSYQWQLCTRTVVPEEVHIMYIKVRGEAPVAGLPAYVWSVL